MNAVLNPLHRPSPNAPPRDGRLSRVCLVLADSKTTRSFSIGRRGGSNPFRPVVHQVPRRVRISLSCPVQGRSVVNVVRFVGTQLPGRYYEGKHLAKASIRLNHSHVLQAPVCLS